MDDDGFGSEVQTTTACALPAGYATDIGDCDDQNAEIHPAQDEFCDEIDNNCNDIVDELDSDDIFAFYQDLDDDGFGDIEHQILACAPPEGFALQFPQIVMIQKFFPIQMFQNLAMKSTMIVMER